MFHAGDAATIFGITQAGFDLSWVNGDGASGYTGLTLHTTDSGMAVSILRSIKVIENMLNMV